MKHTTGTRQQQEEMWKLLDTIFTAHMAHQWYTFLQETHIFIDAIKLKKQNK
jgi:hypothetical protein